MFNEEDCKRWLDGIKKIDDAWGDGVGMFVMNYCSKLASNIFRADRILDEVNKELLEYHMANMIIGLNLLTLHYDLDSEVIMKNLDESLTKPFN